MANSIQIRSFLDSLASQYAASQPLSHAPSSYYPTPYMPVSYGPYFGGGYGGVQRQVVVSDPYSMAMARAMDREDRDESRASSAAVVGGIMTLVLSAVAAFTFSGYFKAAKDLKVARSFQQNELQQMPDNLKGRVTPILAKHIEILEDKCSYNRNVAFASGAALLSGAGAFLGGMFSIHALITVSIIAGVASAAFGIFCAVWQWMNEESLPRCMVQELQRIQNEIRC
jgi:hypothetical protein